MDGIYCGCGIRLRQLFNDVFSCPRCQTIIVRKDHVTMTWRNSTALVLLDEFEKYVTKRLLEHREDAETSIVAPTRIVTASIQECPTEVISQEDLKDLSPCDQCGKPMKMGCNAVCPNCKWVAPCSLG